jgi:hypothetical protein
VAGPFGREEVGTLMKKFTAVVLVAVFAVAACASSGSGSPAATPTGNGSAATTSTATNSVATGSTTASTATTAAAPTQGAGTNTGAGCGDGTWQGKKTKTFCGTAKATIKVGGTTYTIPSGQCVYDASYGFAINTGTMIVGSSDLGNGSFMYFGVVQQPGGKAMATGTMGGVTFVITDGSGSDKVTIAADHQSGSATGTALLTPDAISASFTC